MADSISQQIKKLLKKKPGISKAELSKAFPSARPDTLKHYKKKFDEESGSKAKKTAPKAKAKKVATPKVKTSTKAKKAVTAKPKAAKKVTAPKAKAATKVKKTATPKPKVAAKAKKAAPKTKATTKTVKVVKTKKAVAPKATTKTVTSLKEQIFAFLDKKPGATFSELGKNFKSASQKTIRGYKASYLNLASTKKKTTTKKKAAAPKKAIIVKSSSKTELEKRLAAMEIQIQKLIGEKLGKSGTVKASISSKAKELEGNLLSFIKEKKKGLDDLQHHVTNEISSFLNSIKNKKD